MNKLFMLSIVFVILLSGCATMHKKQAANPLEPRYEIIGDIKLVGTLSTTTMQNLQFTRYWEEFFPQYNKAEHKDNNRFYGTMFWEDQPTMTQDMPINYLVGVPEEVLSDPQEPWVKHTIKGGSYAVFTHKGPVERIQETYMYIYGTWLQNSTYEERYGDQFEYYDERFKDQSPDSIVEIWVPVQKK